MKIYVINKKAAAVLLVSVIMLAISFGITVFDTVAVVTDKREIPIYSVERVEKEVAVTFDSAWGNEDLDSIIKTLDDYGCKATFFVVGDFLDKYPDDVKKLHEHGHEIANHSDNHAHYNSLSRDEMIADMDSCDKKIKDLTGVDNVLFRAPYGEYNNTVVRTCNDTGRYCIQWDVDSLDWKGLTPDMMEKRVFEKIQNGSIMLFHNGAPHTAAALPQILNRLKNEGYIFKTVGEMIYKENYEIDNTGRQISK